MIAPMLRTMMGRWLPLGEEDERGRLVVDNGCVCKFFVTGCKAITKK